MSMKRISGSGAPHRIEASKPPTKETGGATEVPSPSTAAAEHAKFMKQPNGMQGHSVQVLSEPPFGRDILGPDSFIPTNRAS